MPRALFWESAKPGVQVGGAGDVTEVMRTLVETFGRDPNHPLCPIEMGKPHVFTLRSLAGGNGGTLYGAIADIIEAHGQIRLWGRD
jgi:hypothetical protein